ncbi:MAG TPA: poly(A) polymerase, partial [Rickettsiales bacterium]|nr:poly(A) polymerase [Rickettsiales bacterium]
MTIKILENNHFPFEVEKIFQIFNLEESDSIRLVGGCVRDLFLQKQIKDFDFACKFLPEKIIEILEKNNIRAVPTGIKYGTITAVINHKNFEITTLRKDVENDGRYPKTEFVDDYFLDASRRDFTINALYLDEEGKIYDYFDGIPDLQNQKVKFIGDANLRINEDFLRIFRFFRFSCFYAKNLDNQGFQACVKNKNGIKTLSSDRIRIEFFKTLESDDDKKLLEILTAIKDTKIADEIYLYDLEISDLENILNLARSLKIRLSSHIKFAFLILNQHKNLQEIFSRFNFSNDEKKYFSFLFS